MFSPQLAAPCSLSLAALATTCAPSPTLSPTDPVPRGLLTLWARGNTYTPNTSTRNTYATPAQTARHRQHGTQGGRKGQKPRAPGCQETQWARQCVKPSVQVVEAGQARHANTGARTSQTTCAPSATTTLPEHVSTCPCARCNGPTSSSNSTRAALPVRAE